METIDLKIELDKLRDANSLRLRSGLVMDLLHPALNMITLEDIAYGLAYQGRFGGQTKMYYSVAMHSVYVSELAEKECKGMINEIEISLVGLLHDAAEAYIRDMVTPLKVLFNSYREIEKEILRFILVKFGISLSYQEEYLHIVKEYDQQALETEYKFFHIDSDYPLKYRSPDDSARLFLNRYWDLNNRRRERDGK